jgi:hypothetical protein
MLRKLRPRRLNHTTVVAYLSLFVALGGTGAYASHELIDSSDVVDNTLTGGDIRGTNAGTVAATNGSITSADVAGQPSNSALGQPNINGTLLTYDIQDRTLRGGDHALNTLTGAEVSEATLGKVPSATKSDNGIAAKVVADADPSDKGSETMSQAWSTVPGAATTITVPTGGALVIARFTGESLCSFESTSGVCLARIVLDPQGAASAVDMSPGAGVFDEIDFGTSGGAQEQSHAIDRSISASPGTYTVAVQYKVDSDGALFRLDNWHLTVETLASP